LIGQIDLAFMAIGILLFAYKMANAFDLETV